MRRLARFIVLFALASSVAFAQGTSGQPKTTDQQSEIYDINVVPNQSIYLRQQVTTYDMVLDETVSGLAKLDMQILAWYPFGDENGDNSVKPGNLIKDANYLKMDTNISNVLHISYSGPPITGPGVLFSFQTFIPIHNSNYDGGVGGAPYEYANTLKAFDSDGYAMNLSFFSPMLPYDFRRYGDMNHDGKFDITDAITILRAGIGLEKLSTAQAYYADLYPCSKDGKPMPNGRLIGDGTVDVSDSIFAIRKVTGYWKYWWPDD